jgi:tetratricopeptide (TPR) repeat protein
MTRTRIIISILFLFSVIGLFWLPTGVIDSGDDKLSAKDLGDRNTSDSTSLSLVDSHKRDMPIEMIARVSSLKKDLKTANKQQAILLIDSISSIFKSVNQYDSAAGYYEQILAINPLDSNILKTANLYYEAYTFAMNRDKASYLGGKARQYYSIILEKDSGRLDVKNKIAMTYVSSSNPMRGIGMLREILESDPNNEDAIFNMGLLSLQSGQYDKARERFEQLTKINAGNIQGQFYLALCYYESGDKGKARTQFEYVKTIGTDPTILVTVDDYLNELK